MAPAKESDQDSADEDANAAVKKGNIIEKLSKLGIFTRAFHFHDFDQPEASIPTHVFSLSEGKLLTACEEQPDKLFQHNLNHFLRAFPKGTRLTSSNLDPAPFWRFGIQMVRLFLLKQTNTFVANSSQVALNFQKVRAHYENQMIVSNTSYSLRKD